MQTERLRAPNTDVPFLLFRRCRYVCRRRRSAAPGALMARGRAARVATGYHLAYQHSSQFSGTRFHCKAPEVQRVCSRDASKHRRKPSGSRQPPSTPPPSHQLASRAFEELHLPALAGAAGGAALHSRLRSRPGRRRGGRGRQRDMRACPAPCGTALWEDIQGRSCRAAHVFAAAGTHHRIQSGCAAHAPNGRLKGLAPGRQGGQRGGSQALRTRAAAAAEAPHQRVRQLFCFVQRQAVSVCCYCLQSLDRRGVVRQAAAQLLPKVGCFCFRQRCILKRRTRIHRARLAARLQAANGEQPCPGQFARHATPACGRRGGGAVVQHWRLCRTPPCHSAHALLGCWDALGGLGRRQKTRLSGVAARRCCSTPAGSLLAAWASFVLRSRVQGWASAGRPAAAAAGPAAERTSARQRLPPLASARGRRFVPGVATGAAPAAMAMCNEPRCANAC